MRLGLGLRARLRRLRAGPAGIGLKRLEPVSREFGFERGRPVDRFYIERFLDAHRADVRGRVLEVFEDTYTQWFGDDRVTSHEVLHKGTDNPHATLDGDLATGAGLEPHLGTFDCFIMTQTLLLIWDVPAALRNAHDLLKPGGVLLATVPGISQSSPTDKAAYGDWWRFTSQGTRRLFEETFGPGSVEVAAHGNVLAASAFLYGFAQEELSPRQLEHHDPQYELLITARAVRSAAR